jgi:hypothetical protein
MGMRDRLLGGFLLLLFAVFPAFGQNGFTTVSGAIVDPNGIPWAGGTITAQLITQGGTTPTLNGQPFSGTTTSGILGPTGNFTMRLGDSGLIVPSTTTWQFTISIAPGVLPPSGKGPQSFTVTTAINCGTNTPAACASNAMTITAALSPVPALTFTTGGGTPAAPANSLQFNNAGAFGGVGPSATLGNVFTGQTTGPGVFNTTLNYTAPTLTVSAAGSGNGVLALSGNTSGTATFTAPAVAGTVSNAVTMSNVLIGPGGGAGSPTYGGPAGNTGMYFAGGQINFSSNNVATALINNAAGVGLEGLSFSTFTNCNSSASPAVCGSAPAGSVVIAAGATTVQVNTTAVTANSQIFVMNDDSLGTRLSVTCNTTINNVFVSARTGGSNFTISVSAAPVTNPECLSYWVVN